MESSSVTVSSCVVQGGSHDRVSLGEPVEAEMQVCTFTLTRN